MAEAKKSTRAASKKTTAKADVSTSKAAETDASRLAARSTVRGNIRDAQRLDQGEQDRQAARAERQKIADESRAIVEKKRAAAV